MPLILILLGVFIILFGWKIREKLVRIVCFFFGCFIASILLFGVFYNYSNPTYKLISFFIIILVGFLVSEVIKYKEKIGIGIFGALLGSLIGLLVLNMEFINSSLIICVIKSMFLGKTSITSLDIIQNLINLFVILPTLFLGGIFYYREKIGGKILISFIGGLFVSTGFSISNINVKIIWNQGILLSDLFFTILILGFTFQILIDKIITEENQIISFEEIKGKKEGKKENQVEDNEKSNEEEIENFGDFAEENDFNF